MMTKIVCPKCGREVRLDGASRSGSCRACGTSYSLGGAAPLDAAEPRSAVSGGGGSARVSAPWHRSGIYPAPSAAALKKESDGQKVKEMKDASSDVGAVGAASVGAAAVGAAMAGALGVAKEGARIAAEERAAAEADARSAAEKRAAAEADARSAAERKAAAEADARSAAEQKAAAEADARSAAEQKAAAEADARSAAEQKAAAEAEARSAAEERATAAENARIAAEERAESEARARLEAEQRSRLDAEQREKDAALARASADAAEKARLEERARYEAEASARAEAAALAALTAFTARSAVENRAPAASETLAKGRKAGKASERKAPERTPYRASDAERAASEAIAGADKRLVSRRIEHADRSATQKKLRRADRALARRKWKKADALYDDVLLANPECAEAYLGKSLVSRKITGLKPLGKAVELSSDKNFLLALHYSDGSLRRRLDACADASTKEKINASRRELLDSEARRRALDRITDNRLAEIEDRTRRTELETAASGALGEKADRLRTRQISKTLDRADRLRTKGKWKKAAHGYREALKLDPECSDAYVGLLLTDLKLKNERGLARYHRDFESNENFLLAVHFGSRATRKRLESALAAVQEKNGLRPVSSSVRPYRAEPIAPTAPAAPTASVAPILPPIDAASSAELSRVGNALEKRIGGLEAATREKEISYAHISALQARLADAERKALEARINAAEVSAVDARNYALDKAELTARLSATQVELARLRGLLGAPSGDERVTVNGVAITTGREEIPHLQKDADKLRRKGKFARAEEIYRKILTLDPTCPEAYLGCLLCELRLTRTKMLEGHDVSFSDRENFALAVRFSTPEEAARLTRYAEKTERRVSIAEKKREKNKRETERRAISERISEKEAIVISEAGRRMEANLLAGVKISQREEDARVDEIRHLVSKGKYAKAQLLLEELISLSPDLADAYLLRLMCSVPCRSERGLGKASFDLCASPDYILAMRFGSKRTRRMLAKYAKKSRAELPNDAFWNKEKLKKLDAMDKRDEKNRRSEFFRESGDLAEAKRADMDVISARRATARSRVLPISRDKKLLARANRALRRKNWAKASRLFDEAIQKDPACQEAYLGKLLASIPVRRLRELQNSPVSFRANRYYIVLQHIGSPALREKLQTISERVDVRLNRGETEYGKLSESRVMHRRLLLTERRLRDAEARNRRLEKEAERLRAKKGAGAVRDSLLYSEGSQDSLEKGRFFSGFAVLGIVAGVLLLSAFSVGVAVLFAKFGGDLSAFLSALGL